MLVSHRYFPWVAPVNYEVSDVTQVAPIFVTAVALAMCALIVAICPEAIIITSAKDGNPKQVAFTKPTTKESGKQFPSCLRMTTKNMWESNNRVVYIAVVGEVLLCS